MKTLRALLAPLLLAALPAFAVSVPGEPAWATQPRAQAVLRPGAIATKSVTLSPITDAELASVRAANARHARGAATATTPKSAVIGVVRPTSAGALAVGSDLAWRAVAGGHAARVAVTSPGAGSLRVALGLAGVADEVEMVFFGSTDPARLEGPVRVRDVKERTRAWWSPITDGDTQTIEFFVPGTADPRSLPLRVTGASHILTTLESRLTKEVDDIGKAGACTVDVKCSSLASSQAFLNARNAVAEMVLVEEDFIRMCTGTLLADSDATTQVPWMYSANHCLDAEEAPFRTLAQKQVVADTLATLWFFEAATCNSRAVPAFVQHSSGARVLYSDLASDALFIRLNEDAPAGAFFLGWDTAPVPSGASLVSIHHPWGDLKKVSQATALGFVTDPGLNSVGSFVEVRYVSGVDEPGSSGGGILTLDGTQYRLRGGLHGGDAQCTGATPASVAGTDYYSRFDRVYPALAPYLSGSNYSDLWWNAAESGWGLNLIQHEPGGVIFAVWYTYGANGRPAWYVMPGGTWTSSSSFTGTIYATSGPAANQGFDPARVKARAAGTGRLDFSGAGSGTWSYTIDGSSGSKAIVRQPF